VTPAFDPGGSTDPSPARVVLEMRRSAARGLGITLACLGVLPLWGVVTGVAARVWGDPHGVSPGALVGNAVVLLALGTLSGMCLTWRRILRLRARWIEVSTQVLWWRKRRVYEPPYLAIEISTDSDGDVWSRLVVSDARHRSTLASAMTDTSGPRHFGRWLAHRLDVPLEGPRGASDRRHAGL
jgi:hypothetical protein